VVRGARQPERALEYYQRAFSIYPQDSRLLIGAADAAFALGRPALADSLLRQAEQLCRELCVTSLRNQANAARARGDAAAADSLLARAVRLESPCSASTRRSPDSSRWAACSPLIWRWRTGGVDTPAFS